MMMTVGEIDNFVTSNWKVLTIKAKEVYRNCRGKGNYEDLLQEAYLELREKHEKIQTERDATAMFVRFISWQASKYDSHHNRMLGHTLKVSTWHDPVIDDLDDKIELEKLCGEGMCAIDRYKSKGPVQRILASIAIEEGFDSKKIMGRINLPYYNTWTRVKEMKEDIFKEREFTRKERYRMEDFNGTCPGPFLIAGCGPSIEEVKGCNLSSVTVVGVNDIARHVEVDYHCVVDPFHQFSKDRQEIIASTESDVIFTHLPTSKIKHRSSKVCDLKFAKDRGFNGSFDLMPKSTHSTFVAACVAIRLGASSIAFAGMDLLGHPNFQNERIMKQTKKHLVQLIGWCTLNEIKVYNFGRGNILDGMSGVEQVDYEKWIDLVWK